MPLKETIALIEKTIGHTVIASTENHLPLDLHLQRLQLPNNEGKAVYLAEGEDVIGLNLAGLDLSDKALSFLSTESFKYLQSLNLCNNKLENWISPGHLQELVYLELSDNTQLAYVEFPKGLAKLKRLDLSNCSIQSLSFAEGFEALSFFDASYNKNLSKLSFTTSFPKLKYLYLAACALTNLQFTSHLPELTYLFANQNQLPGLELAPNLHFPQMESLELNGNQIKEIHGDFLEPFPNLLNLGLTNNPLPETILSNLDKSPSEDLAFLRRYTKEIEKPDGQVKNREVKILLLGNGNVGKSCFVSRLVHNTFVHTWESTHGIIIKENYQGQEKDKTLALVEPYSYNIWDFAGQDIYHATHRLFMQANALYLVLWDKKTEEDPSTPIEEDGEIRHYENYSLDYWLHYAEKRGNKSPALVIQTKIGEDGKIDLPEVREKYAEDFLLDFHHIESKEADIHDNGYFKLLASMRNAVRNIKELENIPRVWGETRERIKQQKEGGKKWISIPDFEKESGGYEKPLEILRWLTQSGAVFYQEEISEGIILDQEWAIEAIYALFDRKKHFHKIIKTEKGILKGKYLAEKVWNTYEAFERELFIDFLISCEMCFEISEKQDLPFLERSFVAPQLLPDKDETIAEDFWEGKSSVYMRYKHEHFHYGIIQRFIVRTHYLSSNTSLRESRDIWKLGIRLRAKGKKETQWAEVEANEKLIEVRATENAGPLLALIREELFQIREEEGKVDVSIDGQIFVNLKRLESASAKNRSLVLDTAGEEQEVEQFAAFLQREMYVEPIQQERLEAKEISIDSSKKLGEAKKAVSQGNLEGAITILDSLEEEDELVLSFKAQYQNFKTDQIKGLLSQDQVDLTRNRLQDKFLILCKEIDERDSFQGYDSAHESAGSSMRKGRGFGVDSVRSHLQQMEEELPKVYFSYAWGDKEEEGESREEVVNQFYKALAKESFELMRDKMNIQYGGLISEFMEELGAGDLIVVFISDKYVKSEYCMFELLEIARHAKFDKQKFSQRILPVRIESLAFDNPIALESYFQHWEGKQEEWETLMKKRMGQMGEANTKRYHRIKSIHQKFGDLADWLTDINAASYKMLSENDFERVKKAINERLGL